MRDDIERKLRAAQEASATSVAALTAASAALASASASASAAAAKVVRLQRTLDEVKRKEVLKMNHVLMELENEGGSPIGTEDEVESESEEEAPVRPNESSELDIYNGVFDFLSVGTVDGADQ